MSVYYSWSLITYAYVLVISAYLLLALFSLFGLYMLGLRLYLALNSVMPIDLCLALL